MAGITHGFAGYTKVGSVFVLSRPGGQFSMPRALDTPYPISYTNHGLQNYADGLRFPVVNAPAIPMNSASPWFTGALLNSWFMTRSAFPNVDLTAITGGVIFSDNGIVSGTGLGTWRALNPKGAGFRIGTNKGQPVGCILRFAGTDRDTTVGSVPAAPVDGSPLMFDSVTLGGDFANVGITGVLLDVDTGLTPNMELDGTLRPTEMNAGMVSAALTIWMNSTSGADAPGWNSDPTLYTETSGNMTVRRASGAGNSVRFSWTRGVLVNPDERQQQQGRVGRMFTYNLFGSSTTDPVTIADV